MKSFKIEKRNIPNILTIFRLLIIVIILIFIFIPANDNLYSLSWMNSNSNITINFFIAGVFFLIASFSDFLDGYLARRNNWETNFGKIWDPIADKILINSIFIAFSVLNLIPWYLTIIMIVRDTIIDAYRINSATKGIIVKANIFGKLKTVSQMFSIIFIFFIFNSNSLTNIYEYLFIQNLLVFISTIISVSSGIIYVFEITKKIKQNAI